MKVVYEKGSCMGGWFFFLLSAEIALEGILGGKKFVVVLSEN